MPDCQLSITSRWVDTSAAGGSSLASVGNRRGEERGADRRPPARRAGPLYTAGGAPPPRRLRLDRWSRACSRRSSSWSSWSASAWCCATSRPARASALATVSIVVKTLVALHDHDHRLDLGEGGLRPLPVRAGRSSGRTWSACSCWRCTRPTSPPCSPAPSTPREQMLLALAAYATYVVNAAQFLLKLRAARLAGRRQPSRPRLGLAG